MKAVWHWTATAAGVCVPWLAYGAETARESAGKLKGFGLAESSSSLPFGRIVLVFLLLAALAWAAAWLLRRYGSRFGLGGVAIAGGGPIRHVARSSLPGGVACHLVEAQGSRVLITVTRHGVTSQLLPATQVDAVSGVAPLSAEIRP
jgi:hypothetical protein